MQLDVQCIDFISICVPWHLMHITLDEIVYQMNKCMKCEIAFPNQSLWKNSVIK